MMSPQVTRRGLLGVGSRVGTMKVITPVGSWDNSQARVRGETIQLRKDLARRESLKSSGIKAGILRRLRQRLLWLIR